MYKIYSRKRIRIPKLKIFNYDSQKIRIISRMLIILIIAGITFYKVSEAVSSIFEELCIEKAISITTEIINSEANTVLLKYDYKDLVMIIQDEQNSTNILKTDVVVINKIITQIPIAIEKRFKELEKEKIYIPIGAFTGSKYLAGTGPKMDIQIIQTGNVLTEVKSEFESAGINQTVYRIYLEIKGVVNILTPYNTINKEMVSQVLLVETIIVGGVPETYLNMDGLNINNQE